MLELNFINNLLPKLEVDRGFLHTVQTGFDSSGFTFGVGGAAILFGLLALAVLIFYLISKYLKLDEYRVADIEVDQIDNPRQIDRILRRSINLRSLYDLEVYDRNYQEIYKCLPLGFNEEGQLEVDIAAFQDINLDFVNKTVRAAFRMSRRGRQEFYQFETTSLYLGFTEILDVKEKSIRLEIPKIISRGQKRRFVRVEPQHDYAFNINIIQPTRGHGWIPLKYFKPIAEAEVLDISIGGIRAKIRSGARAIPFRINDIVHIYFKLPMMDLEVERVPKNFFIRAKIIDLERLESGERDLKLMFVERGDLNMQSKSVFFHPVTWMSFEDISRWIQAYQRHILQIKRDTQARPENIGNAYAPKPLEVVPKYPSQPLSHGPIEINDRDDEL